MIKYEAYSPMQKPQTIQQFLRFHLGNRVPGNNTYPNPTPSSLDLHTWVLDHAREDLRLSRQQSDLQLHQVSSATLTYAVIANPYLVSTNAPIRV